VLVVTTKATIAYHVAGRYPAGMVVLNGMLTEVGTFTAETRGLMAAQSLHNRKKELQEIANGDGVEQIRVFTVGDFNNRGITSATLHSTSIVFAETNGEMPADHRGSEWVPVENPDHAKIRLTLRINGQEKGEPIDIPLEDLFNGTHLDARIRQQWIDLLKDEKVGRKLPERAIEGALEIDGAEYRIGKDVAANKSVDKILGTTLTHRAVSLVKGIFSDAPDQGKKLVTHNALVSDSPIQGCRDLFNRLIGKSYLREPSSN
jgi:hypothetical protein